MWPFKRKVNLIPRINGNPDNYQFERDKYDSYKYWTPELIEWLAKETDQLKLACGSCLINTNEWPDWVPGRPEGYKTPEANTGALLFFIVDVHRKLEAKAESIQPGVVQPIWMTGYYSTYEPKTCVK